MVRLLFYVAAACLVCKLVTGRWPWDFLRAGSTRAKAVDRARKLLGVRPGASRTEIIEAHRRLVAMVHPDRGGTNEQVHEANAARDLLIDQLPEA
jgi:DnaJ homolog subfamily C member 19